MVLRLNKKGKIIGLVVLSIFFLLVMFIGILNVNAGKPVRPVANLSQCNDHLDNDGDGYCDFKWAKAYCKDGSIPGDPDCASKEDNDETTSCTISCSSNSNCGADGFVSESYCGVDNNIYRDFQTFSCANAGTCTSSCSNQIAPVLTTECSNGCLNGICLAQNQTEPPGTIRQVIFIGVDGMQVAHYQQMLSEGRLASFSRLINEGGWVGNATITKHTATETAPGNAELHSGLPSSITGISSNVCNTAMTAGTTVFERLSSFDQSVELGLVYGKGTCYIPDSILMNSKPLVSFWYNRTNYPQTTYASSACANSINVSNKATEFINQNINKSFYLVVYFGAPDCAGHTYGENSIQYDNSLINVDDGLGVIMDNLVANNISLNTQIIIGGDHGWNEGTTGHGTANYDTLTIPLASNKVSMVGKIYSEGKRKQCDIAPTILSSFGMMSSDYQQITDNGCGSLII